MASQSSESLEAALRYINFTQGTDDLAVVREEARKTSQAVRKVLSDSRLWSRLRQDKTPQYTGDDAHRTAASDLLTDRLTDVMVRVGHTRLPEAKNLIQEALRLNARAETQGLPRATREDLVGACRTALVELHDRLYDFSQVQHADPNAAEDAGEAIEPVLARAKPSLIGMVVVADLVAEPADEDSRLVRMHAVDQSMNIVVRWLSCRECDSAGAPRWL
jgi:hypothetical protein